MTNDDSALQLKLDEIAEEFLSRRRGGEEPTIDEFKERFPEIADQVEQTLKTIQFVDDLNPGSHLTLSSSKSHVHSSAVPELSDFKIIRKIGQGGMGIVYEAEQISLGRLVALKVLPQHFSIDERFVERFKREARAAAKLHHTNIVPVFEVGQHEETLFYSMQFIDGLPLDEVQKEIIRLEEAGTPTNHSSISKLISGSSSGNHSPSQSQTNQNYYKSIAKIGAAVSDALQYAHDRDIVHRDVKPANLLLDGRGVIWLADFGLAKTTDSEITETGDFLGTARYMSPERLKGQGDHRGDVYALGVTLFEMVTLRRPFEAADRVQLMEQIVNRDPRKPSDIRKQVPLDLETIILKAMEKDPRRRYQHASEMANDLRRFVDDQPIHARRASLVERSIRWAKRNKALTAAMLSMAITTVVLIIATILIMQQRDIANTNYLEAQNQGRIADENFQLALDAVDEYFTEVSEETLLNEPGMEGLRAKLLESAGEFYEEFSKRRKDDPNVQIEYVGAVYRTAKIEAEIGSKERAIEMLTSILSDVGPPNLETTDPELIYRLVIIRQALGAYYQSHGEHEKSLKEFKMGEELVRDLNAAHPGNWKYQLEESITISKQVSEAARQSDYVRAMEIAQKAQAVFDKIPVEELNEFQVWLERGRSNRLLGAVSVSSGQYQEAIDYCKLAIEDYQKALAIRPESATAKWYIANSQGIIASMLSRTGHSDESIVVSQQAINTLVGLTESFPMATSYQHDLANRYAILGHAWWGKREFEKAQQQYFAALKYRERLAKAHPSNVDYQIRLARTYQNIGLTYGNLNDQARQEEFYVNAMNLGKTVSEQEPANARLISDLSRYQSGLSNLYVQQNRFDEAEALLEQAIETASSRYAENPQVPELGIAVIEASVSLGELHQVKKEYETAIDVFDSGIKAGLDTLQRAKDNQSVLRQMFAAYLSRGESFFYMGHIDKAIESKTAAIQYAVDERREWIAQLSVEQLKVFQGVQVLSQEFVESVPSELVDGDARLNLELAYIFAAGTVAIHKNEALSEAEKSEKLDDFEKQCIQYLNAYQSFGGINSNSDVESIEKHSFFDVLRSRDSFSTWVDQAKQ